MTSTPSYIDFVRDLVENPPDTPQEVAERTGITLSPVSKDRKLRDEGQGETGDGLMLDEITLSYMPDGTPHVLVFSIPHDAAPMVADVIDAFPGLKLTAVPRGRSLQEETELSRKEDWGTLVFGIAETDRERLRSVIFRFSDTQ